MTLHNPNIRRGSNPNRDPLRRVVTRGWNDAGNEVEDLECGHRIHVREDFVGPTNAVRRRCWQCASQIALEEGLGLS